MALSQEKEYIKSIRFCSFLSSGGVWAPFRGWSNLVEGERPSIFKHLRKAFHLKYYSGKKNVLLFDAWSHGYFHWVSDVLLKLFIIKDELDSWKIILPSTLNKFQEDSLKLFDLNRITSIRGYELGFSPELKIISLPWQSGYFDSELYDEFRLWVVGKVVMSSPSGVKNNSGEKIFLNREKAQSRRIINLPEIQNELLKSGFSVLPVDEMGFIEQVRVFSGCTILAGPHGAGLVNMMFMPERSTIIEFRSSYPDGNNIYERMATRFKHKYIPIISVVDNYDGDFQKADLYVPLDKLCEQLKEIV